MRETLAYLLKLTAPPALRRYLQRTTTAEEARRIMADRMARRSKIFFGLVERTISGLPQSLPPPPPPRRLSAGRLRGLMVREGIKGALRELRARNIYLT